MEILYLRDKDKKYFAKFPPIIAKNGKAWFERNPNHAIIIAFSNIGIGVSILLFILYAEGDANVFCQFEVIDVARLVELAHRSGIRGSYVGAQRFRLLNH